MEDRKLFRAPRAATAWIVPLGVLVGCFPDLDALSSDVDGSSGSGMGGAMAGSAGAGGKAGGAGGKTGGGAGMVGSGGGGSAGGTGATAGTNAGGGSGVAGNGSAGKGGAAAGAGGGGTAGSAAAGAGVGGNGTAGNGMGGQAGSCTEEESSVTATGVEKLTVPLALVGDGQRFNLQNRSNPSMPYDLSGATVTVRAHAPCALGGNLSIFFRSANVIDSPWLKVALSTLTAGFVDIAVPVPAADGNFDPALVDVIRIEVEADGTYGSTFRSPATVVYIDSVVSSNGAVMHPFDLTPSPGDFASSGARPLEGSAYVWLGAYP